MAKKKKQSQKTNNKFENIFTTYITTKSLTSHIYKELLEVRGKRPKILQKNGKKALHKHIEKWPSNIRKHVQLHS